MLLVLSVALGVASKLLFSLQNKEQEEEVYALYTLLIVLLTLLPVLRISAACTPLLPP
jgi:hypothetical protein